MGKWQKWNENDYQFMRTDGAFVEGFEDNWSAFSPDMRPDLEERFASAEAAMAAADLAWPQGEK